MKIQVISIGKTNHPALRKWLPEYIKRISHYVPVDWIELPELKHTKNIRPQDQKEKEGVLVLKAIQQQDVVILFDENGDSMTSKDFASFIQKKMNTGVRNLIFIIGGPYGFSPDVYARAQHNISLSSMTFSHQMVRIFVAEQLYRAFSILNNEPYHHE